MIGAANPGGFGLVASLAGQNRSSPATAGKLLRRA